MDKSTIMMSVRLTNPYTGNGEFAHDIRVVARRPVSATRVPRPVVLPGDSIVGVRRCCVIGKRMGSRARDLILQLSWSRSMNRSLRPRATACERVDTSNFS